MLSVTGMNRFYYLRGFTDMRCKHSRVLSVIRGTVSPQTVTFISSCLKTGVSFACSPMITVLIVFSRKSLFRAISLCV